MDRKIVLPVGFAVMALLAVVGVPTLPSFTAVQSAEASILDTNAVTGNHQETGTLVAQASNVWATHALASENWDPGAPLPSLNSGNLDPSATLPATSSLGSIAGEGGLELVIVPGDAETWGLEPYNPAGGAPDAYSHVTGNHREIDTLVAQASDVSATHALASENWDPGAPLPSLSSGNLHPIATFPAASRLGSIETESTGDQSSEVIGRGNRW